MNTNFKGDIMSWGECERDFVRKVEPDMERVNSIVKSAEIRLKRAKGIKMSDEMLSLVVEDYYEVIKELLTAYLLKNGMRSRNHQCLISFFFKMNPSLEREAYLIQQMSFFRNRLTYYGELIPKEFYEENKEDFDKIIGTIRKLIAIDKKG